MSLKLWLYRCFLSALFMVPLTKSNNLMKDKYHLSYCNCFCGVSNQGRIVGGAGTRPNQYPWQVRIAALNRFMCGGALINDLFVLTAAHCLNKPIVQLKVTFGEHDICRTRKPLSRFVVAAYTKSYNSRNMDNDIALLRLNNRVKFSYTVQPICLPPNLDEDFTNNEAIATGWGTLRSGESRIPCFLQSVKVPVVNHTECSSVYAEVGMKISDNMLCAGEEGKDSCQGDSGGPLMIRTMKNTYELIGIISFGKGCGEPKFPGVYAKVQNYMDWIINTSKDGCFCNYR